jgi:hypothetical protein
LSVSEDESGGEGGERRGGAKRDGVGEEASEVRGQLLLESRSSRPVGENARREEKGEEQDAAAIRARAKGADGGKRRKDLGRRSPVTLDEARPPPGPPFEGEKNDREEHQGDGKLSRGDAIEHTEQTR